ncbi:MAG TPA: Na/Pi symporter [Kofleriaceae bacterium]|nr:Na/Pi symporter [Kofleriaceae bacterium]
MAERHHWRLALGWLLTLAIAVYAISDWGSPDEQKLAATSEDAEETIPLKITSISDGEVSPGDAVVVSYTGASPSPPVEVKVSKKDAEILVREPSSIVVRIPPDLPNGKAALRLHQGTTKSKAWDIHIRTSNHKKLLGRLLGGLALFVFGLGLLALGLRGLAGNRLRTWLGKLTESPARAVGVGALVGAGTQLTTSSAAFTVSLVDSRMLRTGAAVAVLVGAQLGASITGALIPVQLSSESLLVIALGVVWTRVARTRRGTAIAHVVLGAGMMLYGLHLLQTSVEPLVSDPKILPYVDYLRSPGVQSLIRCAVTGMLLAFVLQGPGPVYVLVVGLAQTTTTLPLENALAILAGTNLGAGIAMAIIAWKGPTTRPLARTQLAFAISATLIVMLFIPVWAALATRVVPEELAYGHSVLRTRVAGQLAVAFSVAELAAGGWWMLVLPTLMRRASQSRRAPAVTSNNDSPLERDLAEALTKLRLALAASLQMSISGTRSQSSNAELALGESRTLLESRYRGASSDPQAPQERDVRALIACLQLHRALEQVVHGSELCVERGVAIGEEAKQRLTKMHAIADESFDAILEALAVGTSPDLEEAGAREIRMNALEDEGRKATAHRKPKRDSTMTFAIGVAELIDAFENVGNHLFRVVKALSDELTNA